jgi:hypothetical protein
VWTSRCSSFLIFTAASMKITVFSDVTPCLLPPSSGHQGVIALMMEVVISSETSVN